MLRPGSEGRALCVVPQAQATSMKLFKGLTQYTYFLVESSEQMMFYLYVTVAWLLKYIC